MKRRWLWILIAAVVLGLIAYSLARRLGRGEERAPEDSAVPVLVARPERGPIERTLIYAGTLEPSVMVTITSKTEGRIERILVQEGERVQAGQLLVRMEADVARLELDQAVAAENAALAQADRSRRGVRAEELENARALLAQAEKDLSDAERNHQRTERLFQEGAVAKAGFEDAERRFRAAGTQTENARRNVAMLEQGAGAEEQRLSQANLTAAQAQSGLARLQLGNTQVRSPLAGRVARVLIDEGNMASRSTPLLAVVHDDLLRLSVPVPELHYAEFSRLGRSLPVRVALPALPQAGELPGRVERLSPTIEPASRTFGVEVELANSAGLLRAGMYANVTFVLDRVEDALLVPVQALVTRGGRSGVFVSQGAGSPLASFRETGIGLRTESQVQVLSGLGEQDLVIVEGNAFLEDGQAMTVGGP